MSHAPERHEKNCLNCGATVIGRFCHVCGQENVVPRETFGSLVIHFFYDITHFDGKFFQTLKYLVFRPGFLSKEYINGRRASHLSPVRMYVFTSAIFFLVFFLVVNIKSYINIRSDKEPLTNAERAAMVKDLEEEINKKQKDTSILSRKLQLLQDTILRVSNADLWKVSFWSSDTNSRSYRSVAQYDSVQKNLRPSEKDGWFEGQLVKKEIQLTGKYEGDVRDALLEWIEVFLHKLPYLLFVSLPIFALILKLLYIRRRRFYYVDHTIFTIHHYIFSFIILLILFLLGAAMTKYRLGWVSGVQVALFFVWPVYLYIAMLNFYNQGWFKTFVKFSILNILGFLSLLVLFGVFLFLSIFQM